MEGKVEAPKKKIACVVSRFNDEITGKLLDGAVEVFKVAGMKDEDIHIFKVPGAFEIPILIKNLLATGEYSGAVALSCIIKGDTDHDKYVAGVVTDGIAKLSLEYNIPVTYGVITANNWRQAVDRSGGKIGNRGQDAAEACLELISLISKIGK